MAAITAEDVTSAFWKHEDHFIAHRDTISMKSIRLYLAEQMGTEKAELDAHKSLVKDLVNQIVAKITAMDEAAEQTSPSPQKLKEVDQTEANAEPDSEDRQKKTRKTPEDDEESDDGDLSSPSPKPVKKRAKVGGGSERGSKTAKKPAQKTTATSSYGRKVEKLRNICKRATIPIPPFIYKGKDETLVHERLVELLAKHGLTPGASTESIQEVKKSLTQQRDLDGIDLGNIIEGRPRRGAAAAAIATVNRYALTAQKDHHDSEEDEDDDSTPLKRAQAPDASGSDSEDGSDGAEEEVDESDSDGEQLLDGKDKEATAEPENTETNSSPGAPAQGPEVAACEAKGAESGEEEEQAVATPVEEVRAGRRKVCLGSDDED